MTITNRLVTYFLAALAVVLLGFSFTLYSLASWHLHSQVDRHLRSALDLLVAAIEVHPADVQWEPLERNVTLGNDTDPNQVRWTLHDEQGNLIDCSANLAGQVEPMLKTDWWMLACQLRAGSFDAELVEPAEFQTAATVPHSHAAASLASDRSATREKFVLMVGLLKTPVQAELWNLALTMTAVSLVIWLTAAVAGRWLCRRALLPVRRMAAAARSLQLTPDSDGRIAVGGGNDELTDLGDAFNGLLGTMRGVLDQQRRFAGEASHQLRTPLAAMLAAVDVALRRPREPADYQHALSAVQNRGRDLTKIVETLLALTRYEGAEKLTDAEVVDLNSCCRQRLTIYRDTERASDLLLQGSENPVLVRSHAVLIGQVIDNLLDNALKYSEAGTPVVIEVFRQRDEAVIRIKDQGCGIAPAELAQIFTPFFRSPRVRWDGKPGLGLGLAIAHRFAKLAGGRLEAQSVEGQGSQFQLVLAALSDAEATELAMQATEIGKPLSRMESLR